MFLVQAAGEVGAGRDVAPLVRTTDLQHAVVASIEFRKVVTLQQAVRELGVRNALLVAVDALLYRFLLDHGVDREVLADVTQEIERTHRTKPVEVVGHDGRVGAVEVEKGGHLPANLVDPAGDDVGRVELAFGCLEAGVADHAGGAANQRDRCMPGLLETLEQQDRHQMAEMQAVGGRVEAAIERHRGFIQEFVQCGGIGDLGDEAAGVQVPEQGGLVHRILHD